MNSLTPPNFPISLGPDGYPRKGWKIVNEDLEDYLVTLPQGQKLELVIGGDHLSRMGMFWLANNDKKEIIIIDYR